MDQHWLVYWKTYWKEVSNYSEVDAHWHTSHERFYQEALQDDVIWVVVSGGVGNETEWRLLEHFSVRNKKPADEDSGFRFRLEGDLRRDRESDLSHEAFDPTLPNDMTHILKRLRFATDHPILFSGRKIGQAIQAPRKLAESDALLLARYAKELRES